MISLHDNGRDRDITDGDIVRYVDRECSPEEAQNIAAHLARCDTCRERVEVLERRLGMLSSLLTEADFTLQERVPRRVRFDTPMLRAAAVILVTLGVGLTFTPVRAWVVDAWTRVVESSAPVASEEFADAQGYGIVSFAVEGPSLTIEVGTVQAAGVLRVQVGGEGLVSARVEGGDGSEELVVLPGVLRIESNTTSGADYHVIVPAALTRISIRIGEGEIHDLETADLEGAGVSFALDSPR